MTTPATSIGMPPRERLAMPTQDLSRAPAGVSRAMPPARVAAARLLTFGGAAGLAVLGVYEMVQVVSSGGITGLEWLMTVVFAVTFAWVSLAATTAVAGLISPPSRHVRITEPGGKLISKTALVMPIYNEDPVRTTAALQAMAEDLHAVGEAGAFEIVILSDSNNAESWIRETVAVDRLSRALARIMPVWYRRRWENTAKKAGNLQDFVEKWGGRYDHMVVLDADSLMTAEALVTLAASMEHDPKLGILQTVPVLAEGESLFARLQQFAGKIHGPIVARGVAAWQGSDGNYWGHNAIIRTRAFAEACGLPVLPGKKPFGGPILSHDFVEAALIRRAGWRVEMTSRLGGSWEESPPSLIDVAIRDRRWAQGNLQHSKVIGTRGFTWSNRAHFAIGIMSYLASPLWLALIVSGFALALQAAFIRPEYFTEAFQLFPSWPSLDSERMVRLFLGTMLLLFLPKIFGLVRALFTPEIRRGCGGAHRVVLSCFAEVVASAMYAPIMMAIHSRQVYEILMGRDAGWSAQRRGGGDLTWGEAWQRHRWHTMLGLATAVAAWFVSPGVLAWLSPTLVGLVFAVPLSWASGSRRVGDVIRKSGLLDTPEEREPHPLFRRKAELLAAAESLPAGQALEVLIDDPAVRAAHFRLATAQPHRRGQPDPAFLTAQSKIREAASLAEALDWLNPAERLRVAGNRFMVERLADLPREDGWSRHVDPAYLGVAAE